MNPYKVLLNYLNRQQQLCYMGIASVAADVIKNLKATDNVDSQDGSTNTSPVERKLNGRLRGVLGKPQ